MHKSYIWTSKDCIENIDCGSKLLQVKDDVFASSTFHSHYVPYLFLKRDKYFTITLNTSQIIPEVKPTLLSTKMLSCTHHRMLHNTFDTYVFLNV